MEVLLRDLMMNDLELVMAWRSHPDIYSCFHTQQEPLRWEEHYQWWTTRVNWKRWIIQVNDSSWTRDVGWLGISGLDSWYPDVGILIGETTLWGRGVGKKALLMAIAWLRKEGYQRARASILENNERSQRLFQSVGFKRIGEARVGELLYDINLH